MLREASNPRLKGSDSREASNPRRGLRALSKDKDSPSKIIIL